MAWTVLGTQPPIRLSIVIFGELIAQASAGPNIIEQLPALLVSLTTTAMLQLRTQSPRIEKSTTNIKYQSGGEERRAKKQKMRILSPFYCDKSCS